MNILIDLQSCQSGSSKGGIGRYSFDITKALIQVGSEHNFSILLNSSLPYENEIRYLLKDIVPSLNFNVFSVPDNIAELYDTPQKTRVAELIREKFIADLNPDVLIICSLFEGLGDNVASSIGSIFPRERTVVILYDLIPYVESEKYLTNHILKNHYMNKIEELKKAELYLAISDYSKQEAINLLNISKDKIINISSASNSNFGKVELNHIEKDELKRKYKIRNEFILFTGSYDSRKNHFTLIRAYAKLSFDIRKNYQLVLIGRGNQSIYEYFIKTASEYGVNQSEILFLDDVNDDDLIKLYNIASLFVFPSLREGFGLPVLEAMHCGCPTIGSNTTCIPEVIRSERAMFDPTNPDEIAEKINYFLNNPVEKELLVLEQSEIAKQFSWEISAKTALSFIENNIDISQSDDTTKIYKDIFINKFEEITNLNNKDLSSEFLYECAISYTKNEFNCPKYKDLLMQPGIGWVTSWNTRCGIAAYSKYILENFTNQKVHVFANYDLSTVESDEANVTRCWSSSGNDSLLELENEIYARHIDLVMIQFNYGFFNFDSLRRLIRSLKENGVVVGLTLHSTVDPPTHLYNKKLKSLHEELRDSDFIFVHSIDDLLRLSKIEVSKNVFIINQGFISDLKSEVSSKEERLIATYGYFLPHKGLDVVLEAVKILKDRGFSLRLSMINAEYPAEISKELINKAKKYISSNGLSQQVELITDYLPVLQSINFLKKAKLVIFAYQNTGESSSAAVRMALCSESLVLVTPLEIFKDVEASVIKIKGFDARTVANELQDYLIKLQNRDESLLKKLEVANRFMRTNSWKNISNYLERKITLIANTH